MMNKVEQDVDHLDNQSDESRNVEQKIDTSQVKLFPRMWSYVKISARKSYLVCADAGERLAWFFGITKPKYHAEIQHFESMNEEERQTWRQAFQDIEHTDHIRNSIR